MKLLLLFFSLLLLPALVAAEKPLRASLPIKNIVVGEACRYNIFSKESLIDPPSHFNYADFSLMLDDRRPVKGGTQYSYRIITSRAGSFKVPPLSFMTKSGEKFTTEVGFNSHYLETFTAKWITVKSRKHIYYTKQFLTNKEAYINEAFTSEVRFIVPHTLKIDSWRVPLSNLDKSLVSSGYSPPIGLSGSSDLRNLGVSSLVFENERFIGLSYTAVVHGINEGELSVSPLKVGVNIKVAVMTRIGSQNRSKIFDLSSKSAAIKIKSLPANAPPQFKGDVGTFSMTTSLPEQSQLTTLDSTKVSVTLTGRGNLGTVQAPIVVEKFRKDWKLMDVSRAKSKNRNKGLTGSVTFDFLLVPKKTATTLPKLAYSYFNPQTKAYETLYSRTATVSVIEAAKPNVIETVKVAQQAENQLDILGMIDLNDTSRSRGFSLPFNWQFIPATGGLLIIGLWARKLHKSHLESNSKDGLKKQQLRNLSSQQTNAIDFYKEAGNYIEQWCNEPYPPHAEEIIETRNNSCYMPESEQKSMTVSDKQRKSILRILRSLSVIALFISFTTLTLQTANANATEQAKLNKVASSSPSKSTESSKASTKYTKMIEQLSRQSNLSANQCYNLGNSYYRTHQVGMAALYYHRALLKQPNHPEAKQNLKFINSNISLEVETDSDEKEINLTIAKLEQSTYWLIIKISLWVLALALLTKFTLKPQKTAGSLTTLLSILAFCLILVCLVSVKLYPKSISFAPSKELAVVTKTGYNLKTEPLAISTAAVDKTSDIVELTETSLCKILTTRAMWSYVELPSKTRGWVKSKAVTPIAEQP